VAVPDGPWRIAGVEHIHPVTVPEEARMNPHPIAPLAALPVRSPDPTVALAARVLDEVFGPAAERSFAVRFWDGSTQDPGRPPARFTLVLERPGALRRMLLPPTERRLGEAYLRGDFEIDGSVEAAMALASPLQERMRSRRRALTVFRLLRRLPRRDVEPGAAPGPRRARPPGRLHSLRRDATAVRYHYDASNEFYQLWLDRRMVYSCGYFETGDESLDDAQEAKLDLICRKLRLRPGQHFLDIGCGWGALVLHAAQRYGVHATGITLSEAQAALARERITAAGLGDRCRVEVRDYRQLPGTATFDRIASVGMVEHVGLPRMRQYFDNAYRLLEPGGLFLNHGIVRGEPPRSWLEIAIDRRIRPWKSFIAAYVFPDGEVVTPSEMLGPAEAAGFELRDAESLREHYARTLRHWVARLEARRDEAVAMVGERSYRIWRLYMGGAAYGFGTGRNGLVQLLLARPDAGGRVPLPATRADLYRT
jgi:cyclopropane-fatty-acyl-phospholipid synthase